MMTFPSKRIFFIEYLRIYCILSVFILHLGIYDPAIKQNILNFFCTDGWRPMFAVECFFLIGGFFLYRKTVNCTDDVNDFIRRLWVRLVPAVIFSYLILLVLKAAKWEDFPYVLSLTMGLGFSPANVAGGVDWFVGTYFATACLLYVLFLRFRKSAWALLLVFMTMFWCLQVHGKPEGESWTGAAAGPMFGAILSLSVVRSFTCMGLGIVTASLCDNIKIRGGGILVRLIATTFEIYALYVLFSYMYRSSLVHFRFISIELIFAMLIISGVKGLGLISDLLNRHSCVMHISRYVYSFLLCHGMVIHCFNVHRSFGIEPYKCVWIIVCLTVLFTLIEYHLVEKRLVPWIGHKLSNLCVSSVNN